MFYNMGTAYSVDDDYEYSYDNAGKAMGKTNDFDEYIEDHTHENRVVQFSNVQEEAKKLFINKNRDYGDAFATYGVVGVLIRMNDKIQRSMSITNNGVAMVSNENLRDTLIDLVNYATMGVMLLDEDSERDKLI